MYESLVYQACSLVIELWYMKWRYAIVLSEFRNRYQMRSFIHLTIAAFVAWLNAILDTVVTVVTASLPNKSSRLDMMFWKRKKYYYGIRISSQKGLNRRDNYTPLSCMFFMTGLDVILVAACNHHPLVQLPNVLAWTRVTILSKSTSICAR